MRPNKKKKLEAAGWRVGNTKDFLGLSTHEEKYIELKLALAKKFRALRIKRHLGQTQVAELIESSQSRVAKMESGDSSVSVDRIIRAFFAIGGTASDLGRTISKSHQPSA